MKNLSIILFTAIFGMAFIGGGNIGKQLPKVETKTLKGQSFDVSSLKKPAIISFWSTTCVPCIKELNAINRKYDEWKKSVDFEVYAVSKIGRAHV